MASTKEQALERLRKACGKIEELKPLRRSSPEFAKWKRNTEVATANTFGENTRHLPDFRRIIYLPPIRLGGVTPDRDLQNAYQNGLKKARSILESMLDEIEEYWEVTETKFTDSRHPTQDSHSTSRAFVVHGRDNEVKATVARFLERLQVEPIILHEKANEGRTIVEKFEEYGRVGFAIVLLTPDDVGKLQGDEVLQARARQNVIFEFGYFVGRLGRARVCALKKGELEVPSDYDGVIYITMDDSEGWQVALARELKKAGFAIDMNRVL